MVKKSSLVSVEAIDSLDLFIVYKTDIGSDFQSGKYTRCFVYRSITYQSVDEVKDLKGVIIDGKWKSLSVLIFRLHRSINIQRD